MNLKILSRVLWYPHRIQIICSITGIMLNRKHGSKIKLYSDTLQKLIPGPVTKKFIPAYRK